MRQTLLILFVFVTISTRAQSVKTTSDPSIKDKTYSTFWVIKGEFITLSKQADANNFYSIVKDGITRELIEKGYTAVEDSSAHLIISYIGESVSRVDTENLGPLGQTPAADGTQVDASRNWSREYNQNSMVIEVIEFERRKTIWRASTTFEGQPLSDQRTINAVIFRSFKKFPMNKQKKKK
jgi:hypothetical protein